MRRFIVFFIIICLLSNIYGQELLNDFRNEAKSFVSVNVGVSLPAGRYSHKTIYENYNNPYSVSVPKLPRTGSSDYNVIGFANPGVQFNLKGAWFFYKAFGVGLNMSFSQNLLACKKLDKAYAKAYDDNSSFDFTTNDFYYCTWIMPAIFFSIPISSNFYFGIDAGFGPEYLHTPEFECNYRIGNTSYNEKTNHDSDWDYSYYVTLGAKYKYDKHLGFTVDLTYNDLSLDYDFVTEVSNVKQKSTYTLFYKNMNLSVGVVYFFK